MALINPTPGNGDEKPFIGETYRNEVISKLSLSKQFAIRQQLSNCDALNKDQAIDLLKDAIVQLAHKDFTFNMLLKEDWMNE